MKNKSLSIHELLVHCLYYKLAYNISRYFASHYAKPVTFIVPIGND